MSLRAESLMCRPLSDLQLRPCKPHAERPQDYRVGRGDGSARAQTHRTPQAAIVHSQAY